MQITVYRTSGVEHESAQHLPALLQRDGQAVWVDLDRGNPEEMPLLADVFHFHPLAIEDAQKTGQRPKVEPYDGYLFLTLHTIRELRTGHVLFEEVDVFFTGTVVVTVRSPQAVAVDEARQRLARSPVELSRSADYVLYTIMDAVVDSYFPILDHVEERIERLEENLLRRPSTRTLRILFRLRHTLLEARRQIVPLRDTLNVLMRRETGLVTQAVVLYFRDIYDHVLRIIDQIDTHRDLLTGTLEIYLSITSNRLNEILKVLTAVTAIFAIWTVIAGIYGMNFERAFPSWQSPYGFWGVIAFMGVLSLFIVALFRNRGYL